MEEIDVLKLNDDDDDDDDGDVSYRGVFCCSKCSMIVVVVDVLCELHMKHS